MPRSIHPIACPCRACRNPARHHEWRMDQLKAIRRAQIQRIVILGFGIGFGAVLYLGGLL